MASPAYATRRGSRALSLLLLLIGLAGTTGAAAAAVPAAPLPGIAADLRTALDERFSAIEREAARLRDAGDVKAAEDLEVKLRHFRDRLAGKARSEGEGPELHVVGLYEGAYPPGGGHKGNVHPWGAAAVEVEVTDRPIVLVLCSNEPVKWDVRVAEGVQLKKLILGGYYRQEAAGLPAGVPVEKYTYYKDAGGESADYFYAHSVDAEGYAATALRLKKLTGLGMATFQGMYDFKGRPFEVGPGDPNFEARRVLADLAPTFEAASAFERAGQRESLAALRFTALHCTGRDARIRHRLQNAAAQFTPAGPVADTLQPMPGDINQLAVDPAGPTYYGVEGHGVVRIDPASGKATQMPLDAGLPELSWPRGLTFDTKRRRLVLASWGGVGHLYAYAPDKGRWSALGELKDLDLEALTYSAEEDCLYGLSVHYGEGGHPKLHCFDADGRPRGQGVALSQRLPASAQYLPGGPPIQLVAVGRHLALITPPVHDVDDPNLAERALCLLIDPATGAVTYRGAAEPHPGPPAAAAPTAEQLDALWAALENPDRLAADAAMWKLAAAGDAAVVYLRTKLPAVEPPDPRRIRELVGRFNDPDFVARDEAATLLRRMGVRAEPELRKLLSGGRLSPEAGVRVDGVLRDIRSTAGFFNGEDDDDDGARAAEAARPVHEADLDPHLRRDLRAVQVLARIGSPAAAEYLRELSAGSAEAPLTRGAQSALRRVAQQ